MGELFYTLTPEPCGHFRPSASGEQGGTGSPAEAGGGFCPPKARLSLLLHQPRQLTPKHQRMPKHLKSGLKAMRAALFGMNPPPGFA